MRTRARLPWNWITANPWDRPHHQRFPRPRRIPTGCTALRADPRFSNQRQLGRATACLICAAAPPARSSNGRMPPSAVHPDLETSACNSACSIGQRGNGRNSIGLDCAPCTRLDTLPIGWRADHFHAHLMTENPWIREPAAPAEGLAGRSTDSGHDARGQGSPAPASVGAADCSKLPGFIGTI